ncbi:MAG: glycosyltransferase [Opitutaceae bacterium]|nr:glycosyltransferase [Opitutaceae bacterium]
MSAVFSVILPTHNRAATLDRAVRSVLAQGCGDFELIVIDDGSTDATPEVLARYGAESRMRVVRTPCQGAARARNLGASVARGRYLAFQDSDDEWMPGKLERARVALEAAGPETAVFCGDMIRVMPDGRTMPFPAPRAIETGRLISEVTKDFQVLNIGIQTAVIRRECFEAVGGFDAGLRRYIDMELFVRLALRYRFVHAGEVLATYHDGPGISKDRAALVDARRYLIKKYNGPLRECPEHLAHQYLRLSVALDYDGRKLSSVACALRGWLIAPGRIRAGELGSAIVGRWARIGRSRFR